MDKNTLKNIFSYHPPKNDQIDRYNTIREAGMQFAEIILDNTPECPDQDTAILFVREAVMLANASIAITESVTNNSDIKFGYNVSITIDSNLYFIERGMTLSGVDIKSLAKVPRAFILNQVVGDELVEIPDNLMLPICGGEKFITHIPDGVSN